MREVKSGQKRTSARGPWGASEGEEVVVDGRGREGRLVSGLSHEPAAKLGQRCGVELTGTGRDRMKEEGTEGCGC